MCRGCEIDTGPGWGALWEASTQDERAFQRHRQSAVLKKILASYGISLQELSGDSFLLSNRTGASEVAYGVRHVWGFASKLAGREIDPLDEKILSALEASRL